MSDLRTKALKGVGQYRRLVRGLESAVEKHIRELILRAAEETASVMRANLPVDKGDLRDSVEVVLSKDGLSASVGPGLRGATAIRRRNKPPEITAEDKKGLFQMYKAYWNEYGTKNGQAARHSIQMTRDAVFPGFASEIERAVVKAIAGAQRRGAHVRD